MHAVRMYVCTYDNICEYIEEKIIIIVPQLIIFKTYYMFECNLPLHLAKIHFRLIFICLLENLRVKFIIRLNT